MDQALSERYAAPPAWRRRATIAGVAVLAVVALAWLAWAAFMQSTPKIESQLVGWDVVDAHTATAQVDVHLSDGVGHARCTVQALASDHSIVGELTFTPTAGPNRVTVRTDREATAVQLPGCTADGQDRPR
ncbi:MAG: DUF4307 domain-containing protein [Nocardioides sp.]